MTTQELFTPQEIERYHEFEKAMKYRDFQEWMQIEKNDPGTTATPNANVLHGLNPSGTLGLFGSPGVDPRMYATIVRANGSFSAALPFMPSVFLQERREIVTGINAPTGTNPTGFCGIPMQPGDMKICRQDYEFGDVIAGTQLVDLVNTGAYWNRADVNRDIIPPQLMNAPFMPDILNGADVNSQAYKQFLQLGTNLSRSAEKALIQGNKTAPNTGAGSLEFFIKQFEGVDRLIKTGYVDVPSQVACPAVDSRVANFGAVNVTGVGAQGTIVDYLTDMLTGIEMDVFGDPMGGGMGFDEGSSSWAILLHPRVWRPLTRQWPCAYNTVGCSVLTSVNTQSRLNITAETERQMQDQMYNGKYLMVDGNRIPVLFSWGVPIATVAPDTYNTSIYIVPMRLNGEAVTFMEYFNTGNQYQEQFANIIPSANTRVINGGMYRMGRQEQPMCVLYEIAGKFRLRFDAPFAAGRIDNINVTDRARLRSPFVGDSYYSNGGATTRNNLF